MKLRLVLQKASFKGVSEAAGCRRAAVYYWQGPSSNRSSGKEQFLANHLTENSRRTCINHSRSLVGACNGRCHFPFSFFLTSMIHCEQLRQHKTPSWPSLASYWSKEGGRDTAVQASRAYHLHPGTVRQVPVFFIRQLTHRPAP